MPGCAVPWIKIRNHLLPAPRSTEPSDLYQALWLLIGAVTPGRQGVPDFWSKVRATSDTTSGTQCRADLNRAHKGSSHDPHRIAGSCYPSLYAQESSLGLQEQAVRELLAATAAAA
eukprot:scaffold329375_cov62-Tisochrysis_lutea.AAC.1